MALIGITHCRKLEDYRQAVLHAGGEVRILQASPGGADALADVDGLLLSGGGGGEPARPRAPPHPTPTRPTPPSPTSRRRATTSRSPSSMRRVHVVSRSSPSAAACRSST